MNRKPPERQKTSRSKVIIITIILMPIIAGFVWAYQTHSPSEKMYSLDRQYSYHLEEYNYNKIYRIIPVIGTFHTWKEDEYKIFLYDELKQKALTSGYLGEAYWNDKYGFSLYDNDKFFYGGGDYYKLPRPIDEELLLRERYKIDSLNDANMEQRMNEFYGLPQITDNEAQAYSPVIKSWIDYYTIDLLQARLVKLDTFPPDYNRRELTTEYDSENRKEIEYSPDKRYYADIGYRSKTVNGKVYEEDSYSSRYEVYITDLKEKSNKKITGDAFRLDAVYWVDNTTFIAVGERHDWFARYQLWVFNITDKTIKQYDIKNENDHKYEAGEYHKVYMREKGIIPHSYK